MRRDGLAILANASTMANSFFHLIHPHCGCRRALPVRHGPPGACAHGLYAIEIGRDQGATRLRPLVYLAARWPLVIALRLRDPPASLARLLLVACWLLALVRPAPQAVALRREVHGGGQSLSCGQRERDEAGVLIERVRSENQGEARGCLTPGRIENQSHSAGEHKGIPQQTRTGRECAVINAANQPATRLCAPTPHSSISYREHCREMRLANSCLVTSAGTRMPLTDTSWSPGCGGQSARCAAPPAVTSSTRTSPFCNRNPQSCPVNFQRAQRRVTCRKRKRSPRP